MSMDRYVKQISEHEAKKSWVVTPAKDNRSKPADKVELNNNK